MQDEITACLEKGFELGVRWTDENGVLNDAYESNRPENFAPACWAVIGASLYRGQRGQGQVGQPRRKRRHPDQPGKSSQESL